MAEPVKEQNGQNILTIKMGSFIFIYHYEKFIEYINRAEQLNCKTILRQTKNDENQKKGGVKLIDEKDNLIQRSVVYQVYQ